MSQFNLAIPFVLKHEGKLVNNPADPGGITNYGISLRYLSALAQEHPELLSEICLDGKSTVDADDIQRMAVEEAIDLYRREWWDKYGYGNIENQAVANKVFDLSVNIGASEAIKFLQSACCQEAGAGYLVIDGVLGRASINYINRLSMTQQNNLLTSFCDIAADYYRRLVTQHPVYEKFLQGWLNRVYDHE